MDESSAAESPSGFSTLFATSTIGRSAKAVLRPWYQRYQASTVHATVGDIELALPRRFVHHYVKNPYEPLTTSSLLGSLRPGMVFLDVGTHVGFYTVMAAKRLGPTGHVHAVEPSPDNLEFLRGNIRANALRNVTIYPFAAGCERRLRSFNVAGTGDCHSFYEHPLTRSSEFSQVQEIPLDDMIGPPVNSIKLDVEGAEIEALKGMSGLIRDSGQVSLWVEWNPACLRNAGHKPLDLVDCLQDLGCRRMTVLDDVEKRERPLRDVIREMEHMQLPESWYVTLHATFGTA